MITAVDSNILIDIFFNDKQFEAASENALKQCLKEGVVCACDLVWTETAIGFSDGETFFDAMHTIDIEFSAIYEKTTWVAAHVWHQYRQSGGKREKLPPDFLIGAHALTQCDRLLTRDRGFYRQYFTTLKLVTP